MPAPKKIHGGYLNPTEMWSRAMVDVTNNLVDQALEKVYVSLKKNPLAREVFIYFEDEHVRSDVSAFVAAQLQALGYSVGPAEGRDRNYLSVSGWSRPVRQDPPTQPRLGPQT